MKLRVDTVQVLRCLGVWFSVCVVPLVVLAIGLERPRLACIQRTSAMVTDGARVRRIPSRLTKQNYPHLLVGCKLHSVIRRDADLVAKFVDEHHVLRDILHQAE